MKPYITIIVLILLATHVIAGEIPNDFLQTDNSQLKTYINTLLAFPDSRITLRTFVDCLKFPHICIKGNDYDPHDIMTNMVLLSDRKLLQRQALWELKQQTGYNIKIDNKYGTLSINYPKREILK